MNHRFSCPQIWFSVFPHIIPKYDGRCPHILPENDHFFMSECPDWKQHPGKTPPLLRLGSKWSEALWKAQPGPRGLTTDDGTYGLKAQKIIEISLILGQNILEQFVYWVIYIYIRIVACLDSWPVEFVHHNFFSCLPICVCFLLS